MKKTVWLDIDQAAEVLGITAHELSLSRYRGMAPGNLAQKVDGQLRWDKAKLPKPKSEVEVTE